MLHQLPSLFLYRASIASVLAGTLLNDSFYDQCLSGPNTVEKWKLVLDRLMGMLHGIGDRAVIQSDEQLLLVACILITELCTNDNPHFIRLYAQLRYPQFQKIVGRHVPQNPSEQYIWIYHGLRHGIARTFGRVVPPICWPWTLHRMSMLDIPGGPYYSLFAKSSLEERAGRRPTTFTTDSTLKETVLLRHSFVCNFISAAVRELKAAVDTILSDEMGPWSAADSEDDEEEEEEDIESSESSHRSMSSEDVPGKCRICDSAYDPDSSDDDGCCSEHHGNQDYGPSSSDSSSSGG